MLSNVCSACPTLDATSPASRMPMWFTITWSTIFCMAFKSFHWICSIKWACLMKLALISSFNFSTNRRASCKLSPSISTSCSISPFQNGLVPSRHRGLAFMISPTCVHRLHILSLLRNQCVFSCARHSSFMAFVTVAIHLHTPS